MRPPFALCVASSFAAIAFAGFALAAPTVTLLPSGEFVSSLSYDGTVACGNVVWDGSYETFRWTAAGGVVRLGRDTVIPIGRGSGTPDISYNGNQVSASILSSDYQVTQGLWDIDSGWIETMPPSPPGGALVDDGYGSAWGLSGNGQVLTGFYWNASYRAIASWWSASTGVLALGQDAGQSARANATNYDGSVTCGWEEGPGGSWYPRAWRNGTKYVLDNVDGGVNTGEATNGDGSLIVGSSYDENSALNVGTIWSWNGSGYTTTQVGALPDTPPGLGQAILLSITNDGSLAVGVNQYSWGSTEGMVWTPGTGLISASAYFAMVGVVLPDGHSIADCYNVSADGSTINATIIDDETFNYYSAIIRLRQPCPGDLNNDGQVDDSDFVSFAAQYDVLECASASMPGYCRADMNSDEYVDDTDFVLFSQAYNQLVCP